MIVLLVAAVATVVVDVTTKQLVIAVLAEGRLYALAPGWGVRRVDNQRGALGRVPVWQVALLWVAWVGTVLVCVRLSSAQPNTLTAVGLGMAMGGAGGNVVDRIRRGAVIDFVAAGPWPVFNLADAAMVIGALMAAVSVV